MTAEPLRFLSHEERIDRVQSLEYRVMVFAPRGSYPQGTFHVPNGVFHADEEIAFSIVLGESWRTHDPEVPFSEFDWASPQELRLIASLILCEVMDGPPIRLYPLVRFSPWLNARNMDLSSPVTLHEVRDLLMHHTRQPQSIHNEWNPLAACRSKYDLTDPREFALDRQREFWDALATPNYVLVRGVYALMKSDMLSSHYEFSEEAVHALYIALDASFSLVIRQLKSQGVANPTAHDAQVWMHRHFNAAFGLAAPEAADKYFREFYEQRVMTFHPASRYGDLPFSPNMHDDIFHLRRWLREVFGYLMIGRHDPGYEDALRKHLERQLPPSG
jgi:hypothetical protein